MSEQEKYSRRIFLAKFATLSTATLMLNSNCGKSSDPGPAVMYGPAPVRTVVTGMFFIDAQAVQVPLKGSAAVPVHTQFVINFSADMLMSSVADAISLTDPNKNSVACTITWDTTKSFDRTIKVIPLSDLQHNTMYTLSVGGAALDSYSARLDVTADAVAEFTTST